MKNGWFHPNFSQQHTQLSICCQLSIQQICIPASHSLLGLHQPLLATPILLQLICRMQLCRAEEAAWKERPQSSRATHCGRRGEILNASAVTATWSTAVFAPCNMLILTKGAFKMDEIQTIQQMSVLCGERQHIIAIPEGSHVGLQQKLGPVAPQKPISISRYKKSSLCQICLTRGGLDIPPV